MSHIGADSTQSFAEEFGDVLTSAQIERSVSISNRFHRILTACEVVADAATVFIAVIAGYGTYHFLHLGRRLEYSAHKIGLVALGLAVIYVILLDRDGAYRPGNSLLRIKETERTLRVSLQSFLLILPLTFFTGHIFSRWVFIIALFFVPVLQVAEKQLLFAFVRRLRSRGIGVNRVLIYGAGSSGQRVFSALVRSPQLGLVPVALIDDNPQLEGREIFEFAYRREYSIKVISRRVTRELLDELGCNFLLVAIPSLPPARFEEAVSIARAANARMAFVPRQAIRSDYWTEHADIDGILLNVVGQPPHDWLYEDAKRLFDIFAALTLIVMLAPLWITILTLVKIDSPGPVLFRQKRVGRKGVLFDIFKIRTMHIDASQYDYSPKQSMDPRITRIGRFLRRTSLDELAQLINVLKGEMSLVGPRPEMPFIVQQYDARQRQRLQVAPGITGLWQLSADRAYLIHENIHYDLYYIRNRSFFMDFAILLHTVVFAMRGV
jgi:exopolysaccharide biosynthesis polyprenyl glycosylphosphotransferase